MATYLNFECWGFNLYSKCYMKYVYIYVNIYAYTLLAKKLCDSSFLGKHLGLIHSHFNMYGFRSYLFLDIIKWHVG